MSYTSGSSSSQNSQAGQQYSYMMDQIDTLEKKIFETTRSPGKDHSEIVSEIRGLANQLSRCSLDQGQKEAITNKLNVLDTSIEKVDNMPSVAYVDSATASEFIQQAKESIIAAREALNPPTFAEIKNLLGMITSNVFGSFSGTVTKETMSKNIKDTLSKATRFIMNNSSHDEMKELNKILSGQIVACEMNCIPIAQNTFPKDMPVYQSLVSNMRALEDLTDQMSRSSSSVSSIANSEMVPSIDLEVDVPVKRIDPNKGMGFTDAISFLDPSLRKEVMDLRATLTSMRGIKADSKLNPETMQFQNEKLSMYELTKGPWERHEEALQRIQRQSGDLCKKLLSDGEGDSVHPMRFTVPSEVAKAIIDTLSSDFKNAYRELGQLPNKLANEGGMLTRASTIESKKQAFEATINAFGKEINDDLNRLKNGLVEKADVSKLYKVIIPRPSPEKIQSDLQVYDLAMAFPSDSIERKWLCASLAAKDGDSKGFGDKHIELEHLSTADIHKEYLETKVDGEPKILSLVSKYSDDTIFKDMVMWVMENVDPAKIDAARGDIDKLVDVMATYFQQYRFDSEKQNRGHGASMTGSLNKAKMDPTQWKTVPFDPAKAGCGVAMRAMPLGLVFTGPENREKLVECAIKSGYVTHQSPIGFLGGVTTALFSALAAEDVPFSQWPAELLKLTQDGGMAREKADFINREGREIHYEQAWKDFNHVWNNYKQNRFTGDESFNTSRYTDTPEGRDKINLQSCYLQGGKYPGQEGALSRDSLTVNDTNAGVRAWPGANGHDAGIIAYDDLMLTIKAFLKDQENIPGGAINQSAIALLRPSDLKNFLIAAGPDAQKKFYLGLVERACLHGGDSDSTGTIAMYWYGVCVEELGLRPESLKNAEKSIYYTPSEQLKDKASASARSNSSSSVSAAPPSSVSEVSIVSFNGKTYPVGTVFRKAEIPVNIEAVNRRDVPLKKGDIVFYDRGSNEFIVGKILEGEDRPTGVKIDLGVFQNEVPNSTRILRGAGGHGGAFFNGIYRLK